MQAVSSVTLDVQLVCVHRIDIELQDNTLLSVSKGIHPNKEVRKAIRQLEQAGWTIEVATGRSAHRWGAAFCPARNPACTTGIAGSPRVPEDQASRLLKSGAKCKCQEVDRPRRP